jgi:hypothetical protein
LTRSRLELRSKPSHRLSETEIDGSAITHLTFLRPTNVYPVKGKTEGPNRKAVETDRELTARMARADEGRSRSQGEKMSDRAAMLRETVQAFTDLRAMFDRLTEEQASRVWLGVLGVRDIVIHKHGPATLRGCGDETSQAAESIRTARSFLAPGSFGGLRFPSEANGT